MKSDTCREKLKDKRKMYRRSDGRQELQSCISGRISQAVNGVHSAVVSYGLAFVSSERVPPSCRSLKLKTATFGGKIQILWKLIVIDEDVYCSQRSACQHNY